MEWLSYEENDYSDQTADIPFYSLKGNYKKTDYEEFMKSEFLKQWSIENQLNETILRTLLTNVRIVIFYKDDHDEHHDLSQEQYVYILKTYRNNETHNTIYCVGCIERLFNNNLNNKCKRQKANDISNSSFTGNVRLYMLGFITASHPVLKDVKNFDPKNNIILFKQVLEEPIYMFPFKNLSLDLEKVLNTFQSNEEDNIVDYDNNYNNDSTFVSEQIVCGIYILSMRDKIDEDDKNYMKSKMKLEKDILCRIQFLGNLFRYKEDENKIKEIKEEQILLFPTNNKYNWNRDKVLIHLIPVAVASFLSNNDDSNEKILFKSYITAEKLYLKNCLHNYELTERKKEEILKMNNINNQIKSSDPENEFIDQICNLHEQNLIQLMERIKQKKINNNNNTIFYKFIKNCHQYMNKIFEN